MAGGSAGPVGGDAIRRAPAAASAVPLRAKQLTRLLALELPAERVEATLAALQMQVTRSASGWQVTPAAYRFDIGFEADLIEEVAVWWALRRFSGTDCSGPQRFRSLPRSTLRNRRCSGSSGARLPRGDHARFRRSRAAERLFPGRRRWPSNPIASDLSVMRVSLWPGLAARSA